MRKISEQTRDILKKDKQMKACCLRSTKFDLCKGRINWHHNLIYEGKQSDIPETILPLCEGFHHRYADQTDIKEQLDWIMLYRMSDEQIKSISKAVDYFQRKIYLTSKFGTPNLKGIISIPQSARDFVKEKYAIRNI